MGKNFQGNVSQKKINIQEIPKMKSNVYTCMLFTDTFSNFNVLTDLKKNNNNTLCCYKPNDCLTVLWAISINFSLLSLHVFAASTFAALSSLGSVIIVYRPIHIQNFCTVNELMKHWLKLEYNSSHIQFMLVCSLFDAPRVGANYFPLTRTLHHYE